MTTSPAFYPAPSLARAAGVPLATARELIADREADGSLLVARHRGVPGLLLPADFFAEGAT